MAHAHAHAVCTTFPPPRPLEGLGRDDANEHSIVQSSSTDKSRELESMPHVELVAQGVVRDRVTAPVAMAETVEVLLEFRESRRQLCVPQNEICQAVTNELATLGKEGVAIELHRKSSSSPHAYLLQRWTPK